MKYPVLVEDVVFEEEIKKSRFITYLHRVDSLQEGRDYLNYLRSIHPKAVHHCWACLGQAPDNTQHWGFSDDGEPSGTAGRPMFTTLHGSGLGNVIAVTVRYFGGILLGTGGLCRAYANGVAQALALAQTQLYTEKSKYQTALPYNFHPVFKDLLKRYDGQIVLEDFTDEVIVDFLLPPESIEELSAEVANRTSGTVFIYNAEE